MYNSKTNDKGQKLVDRGNEVLSHDAAKLLKTQDAGYLKTLAQQTRRAREKLEKEYILKDGKMAQVLGQKLNADKSQHIFFVRSADEQRRIDVKSIMNRTDGEGNGSHDFEEGCQDSEHIERPAPPSVQVKSGKLLVAEAAAQKQASALHKRRKRSHEAQSLKLKALQSRERDVMAAERELDLQRAKMNNSIGGVNKLGVRFKARERKK